MKVFAVTLLAVGMAAAVDRQMNYSRYTDATIRMVMEIKRGFLERENRRGSLPTLSSDNDWS